MEAVSELTELREEALEAEGEITPEAAQEAAEATEAFAEAQLSTGEGAEAISGQEEIVNPPLKEALELAEELGFGEEEEGLSEESSEGSEGSEGFSLGRKNFCY